MNSLKTILLILSAMTLNTFSQTLPLEPGVSQTLARWRAAHYRDVRYKLNITLEKGAPLMKGAIEIRVNVDAEGAKNELVLDWRTTAFENDKDKPSLDVVAVNESVIKKLPDSNKYAWMTSKEHLVIAPRLLKTGENVIKIEFASPIKTSGAAITRYVDKEDGAEYVYSLFVPSDASTAFPVFDQPDLKARFQLNAFVPGNWKVVSNTNEKVKFEIVEASGLRGKPQSVSVPINNSIIFEETKPISTYVFAFAAGDFSLFKECIYLKPESKNELVNCVTNRNENVSNTSRIYVRKSQAEKFKQHATEVFRLNREAVKYLEGYFDYKFPFPKYDLVLIPEFPFGGMEHAGATFLREDRVIFPTEPTKNDYITRANLIFHEAAHQWFGDTVTMKWFDDLWLKEGFAEFMAYKTLEKVMPEYNAWKIFYERNKQSAYLTDSTRGTTPIYQEIPNLSAAKSAYGNIVYRKAPSFLKQAEFYLGEKEFQTAVRQFLKKHEFANAEWTDLVGEFETASKRDLKGWGEGWVKQRGMPLISKLPSREHKAESLCCYYSFFQRSVLGDDYLWKTKLEFLAISVNAQTQKEEDRRIFNLEFDGKDGWGKAVKDGQIFRSFPEISGGSSYPVYIPNYQDHGYGIFLLDERSRAYVLANIQTEKDDFLRAMMWGSLWDSVRETELAPADYVRLVIKNLNVETDESTIQTLLGRVSTAMNYYLSDAEAKEFAPQLETLLIEKMRNAPTVGQRITFYRAFLNLASSEKARTILKELLNGKFAIKDLQLKPKDRFDIMTRLAVLDDKEGKEMVYKYFAADLKLTDEERRYAFAAGAAIPDKEVKQSYFKKFLEDKNISESYIEAAFLPFNSPRHSELTLQYLEKALAELPNLKRNRKIFFVNGWLAAFIGGQKSEAALSIVNKFLADNPNLDKDLRLKILENADALERSVKIRAKYAK